QGPRLEILNGENAGNALMLDKSMVKVGQPGQQMAVVTKREDAYFITHVSGDNHPFVNGKQIGAQACALHNNDEIEVLDTKMAFHLD
ncbi:MAG: FHA domain-containing protein, partial [Methylophilaceae bacterium]